MAADAPRLVAIDSATERLAVAVIAGERQWTAEEEGGARTSLRLLPLAFELLQQAGLGPAQLDAVAFGRGPGAFTGLRSACSAAQGLALGSGCPVLPLDSLALVAEDALAQHIDAAQGLWVAMDARMDEIYAGAYRYDGGAWQAMIEPALWTLPALAAAWSSSPPHLVAGSAVAAFADRLPFGDALLAPRMRDRAAALARLARAAWTRGGAAVDAADALPLYLRDKVALTTVEREALGAR